MIFPLFHLTCFRCLAKHLRLKIQIQMGTEPNKEDVSLPVILFALKSLQVLIMQSCGSLKVLAIRRKLRLYILI